MIKFLDLAFQYQNIKSEIDRRVQDVISKAAFVGGAEVKAFEKAFATYCDVRFCVGVGNGTDALEIAIESLSLPVGSEIIVPANSFIASSEAVTRQGHKVVFADCDADSYTISVKDAERRITSKTKAIIAVHLYGHPCDMDQLKGLADKYQLHIIEDCAQAHGAKYKGNRVGSIGDVAAFSFYPGKNLGAYGDGGAITTNSAKIAESCRKIANHGRISKYDHEFEGRNSRLDAIQAAILSVKLPHLERWTDKRRNAASIYAHMLGGIAEIKLPQTKAEVEHVYHLYVVRSKRRDELKQFMAKRGIETGIHYPIALPKLAPYKGHQDKTKDFDACTFDDQLLSLPMGDHLSDDECREVGQTVIDFYNDSSV